MWTALTVPKETWALKESQAHLGSRVSPGRRVFPVLKARSDHLERKDPRVDLGWLVYLELMVPLDILGRRDPPERREPSVKQGPRDQSVILAPVESRVLTVSAASRVERERRVRTASPDSRETWVSRETGESLVFWGPVVRMVLRAPRAGRAPTESQAPWVTLVKRVSWGSPDCQAIQDDRGPRAQVASLGSLEPMEKKEAGAWQVNRGRGDREVRRVRVVDEEPEVPQASRAPRAQQATTDPQARPARGGLKDPRGRSASPDPRAHPDLQGRTVCPDTLASVERQDSKGRQAHLAPEELLAPRDPPERQAPWAREDTPDPRAPPENRVYLVLLARREQRETPALRGLPGKTDLPASEASPGSEVYPVPRVLLV